MKIIALLFSLLIAFELGAQLSSEEVQQIDSLFLDWNQANHPGGSIGIMENSKLVYTRAFGLASLEYQVPNTVGTQYNIASVSKQFTAMGIVILHNQGKLSVDDDIRKHLPELPDFGPKITIRHMLQHTSGLRSLHALFALAGWRGDDARTNEDLNRIILNQKELNFIPGDEYTYCNTGYMLMVNIIEKVSGEQFIPWMTSNIFEPMNMHQTYVEDNYARVVPNNATSYYMSDDEVERAVEYWGYIGSGNIHSTTGDLLIWLENFHKPMPGWKDHFDMLQTLNPLNNGTWNDYAFGLRISDFLGYKSIGHGGAIGGFRSSIITYPLLKLNIVILSNFSRANPGGKSRDISRILLEDLSAVKKTASTASQKAIKLSLEELNKFEGYYWNDTHNYSRKIYVRNDTLRYFRSEENESPLIPIAKNKFVMANRDQALAVVFKTELNRTQMILEIENQAPNISVQYQAVEQTETEMNEYAGIYYSPEIETTYKITYKDDTLRWHHSRHGNKPIKRIKKDVLDSNWPMNTIKIQRNELGKVSGIRVSNGRVKHLWFEKQQ